MPRTRSGKISLQKGGAKPRTKVSCIRTLAASLFTIREYLVHYLQVSRKNTGFAATISDRQIVCHVLEIPRNLLKEFELRLVFCMPSAASPPVIVLRISLEYFFPEFCNIVKATPLLLKPGGFAAVQICLKDESDEELSEETQPFCRSWILLNRAQYRQLSARIPENSVFFQETHFELQVKEVFRQYGGLAIFPPSLN